MPEPTSSFENLIASESFQRYCLGISDEDRLKWDEWRAESAENANLFKEAKKWIISLRGMTEEEEIQAELAQLKRALQPAIPLARKRTYGFQPWMGIAASLAILFASAFLWQILKPAPLQTLATGYGQVTEQVLPDGSEISLNANSEIRFAESWEDASQREVWLKGEAYFQVAHNADMPFIVHTAEGDIKVLGTSFNALQRAEFLRVALVEGSVALSPTDQPGQTFVMKPGEEFRLSDEGISLQSADLEPISAWKDHKMVFREVSIAHIAEKLKWDFNLDITFTREEILYRKVNAFIQESNPKLLLEALAEIYDLNIRKTGERSYLIE